jgi:hypothetical protein
MQALSLSGELNDGVLESFGKAPESLGKGRERESPVGSRRLLRMRNGSGCRYGPAAT